MSGPPGNPQHRSAADAMLDRSWRRAQVMGALTALAILAMVFVGGTEDGLPRDVMQLVLRIVVVAGLYSTVRYLVSLVRFDREGGQAWRVGLTTLRTGELGTGSARVLAIRPWLPRAIDNARARLVIAERYPADPTWWQGARYSFPALARVAADDGAAVVLSAPDGGSILVGEPGHAGVVLRRIADPRVPDSRRRDRFIGLVNRVGIAGLLVGLAVVLLNRFDIGTGPAGSLAALVIVGWGLARAALAAMAVAADRDAISRVATTLVAPSDTPDTSRTRDASEPPGDGRHG